MSVALYELGFSADTRFTRTQKPITFSRKPVLPPTDDSLYDVPPSITAQTITYSHLLQQESENLLKKIALPNIQTVFSPAIRRLKHWHYMATDYGYHNTHSWGYKKGENELVHPRFYYDYDLERYMHGDPHETKYYEEAHAYIAPELRRNTNYIPATSPLSISWPNTSPIPVPDWMEPIYTAVRTAYESDNVYQVLKRQARTAPESRQVTPLQPAISFSERPARLSRSDQLYQSVTLTPVVENPQAFWITSTKDPGHCLVQVHHGRLILSFTRPLSNSTNEKNLLTTTIVMGKSFEPYQFDTLTKDIRPMYSKDQLEALITTPPYDIRPVSKDELEPVREGLEIVLRRYEKGLRSQNPPLDSLPGERQFILKQALRVLSKPTLASVMQA